MSFIDFQELKGRVDIQAACSFLQLDLKPNGKQLRGACPSCPSGGERSLVITPEKGAAYCFTAKKGGDVIWLTSHIRGESQKDAAHFLYEAFGGRVFALEQKTLTETPITNLLQFLAQWPSAGGPPLVLLSHSRGGIVGDFLSSLRDWEEQPRGLLDALSPGSIEKNQLLELQTKIITLEPRQRPSVLRHIRVGTPAAGTSLASDKTHIWLSVLASLSGAIPGVGGGLGAIGDIAVATVKEALKPGVLPGIDAQKPDSDFVKIAQLLNCKNTDLLAVTGSCKGVLKRTLGAIFGDDNDLIVNWVNAVWPMYN